MSGCVAEGSTLFMPLTVELNVEWVQRSNFAVRQGRIVVGNPQPFLAGRTGLGVGALVRGRIPFFPKRIGRIRGLRSLRVGYADWLTTAADLRQLDPQGHRHSTVGRGLSWRRVAVEPNPVPRAQPSRPSHSLPLSCRFCWLPEVRAYDSAIRPVSRVHTTATQQLPTVNLGGCYCTDFYKAVFGLSVCL
jgi:hypothetical protein